MFRAVVPAAVLALALLPVPAQGVAPSPVKVVKTTKLPGEEYLSEVIAPTRRSAFAFGSRGRGARPVIAYRYDGRTWRATALPKSVKGSVEDADFTSANNVWAAVPGDLTLTDRFNPMLKFVEELGDCPVFRTGGLGRLAAARANAGAAEQPSRLLHWNGKKWTVAKTFESAAVLDVVTRGPKDVRAFGVDREGPAAWHFTGRTWKRSAAPGLLVSVTKGPGRTLWAVSVTGSGQRIVRFDGRRWRNATPKSVPRQVIPTADKSGVIPVLSQPVLSGGRAHVALTTLSGKACDGLEHAGSLLTWNGRRWSRAAYPYVNADLFVDSMAPDGSGGIDLLAESNPSVFGEPTESEFTLLHRTAKGRWTTATLPRGSRDLYYFDITHIPGTTSFWSVGELEGSRDLDAFIARKGNA